jgi:hypothetical protein
MAAVEAVEMMITTFALLVVQSLAAAMGNLTAISLSTDIPARKIPDIKLLVVSK